MHPCFWFFRPRQKAEKTYDLKVSDVKVSSKNLKPGDKCKISMKIVNRGYGKMKNVYVCYDSPSTQVYYVPLQYKRAAADGLEISKVKRECRREPGVSGVLM